MILIWINININVNYRLSEKSSMLLPSMTWEYFWKNNCILTPNCYKKNAFFLMVNNSILDFCDIFVSGL